MARQSRTLATLGRSTDGVAGRRLRLSQGTMPPPEAPMAATPQATSRGGGASWRGSLTAARPSQYAAWAQPPPSLPASTPMVRARSAVSSRAPTLQSAAMQPGG